MHEVTGVAAVDTIVAAVAGVHWSRRIADKEPANGRRRRRPNAQVSTFNPSILARMEIRITAQSIPLSWSKPTMTVWSAWHLTLANVSDVSISASSGMAKTQVQCPHTLWKQIQQPLYTTIARPLA